MYVINKYSEDQKARWNEFNRLAKNGNFLFDRDYMDYHKDRFEDHSLMVYKKDKLICIIPACKVQNSIISHAGLTFGGVIISKKATAVDVIDIVKSINRYCNISGFDSFELKLLPYIYSKFPMQEILYALNISGWYLRDSKLSVAINLDASLPLRSTKKQNIKKSKEIDFEIHESDDYDSFWPVLNSVLESRHSANAVHSVEEIKDLASKFKNQIKLYVAKIGNEIVSGTILYISDNVVHTQYLCATPFARENGILDALIQYLIKIYSSTAGYFDFGTSNDDSENGLNEGLIFQKEGFGARGIVYDTYSISLK